MDKSEEKRETPDITDLLETEIVNDTTKNVNENLATEYAEQVETNKVVEDEIGADTTNKNDEINVESHVLTDSETRFDSVFLQEFDSRRLKFLKIYKIQNIFKWIVSILSLGIVIFAWLGGTLWDWEIWITLTLAIVGLVIFIAYAISIRFYLKHRTKVYFEDYYKYTSNYVFDADKYQNVVVKPNDKIEPIQFIETDLYRNIIQVGSRSIINYNFHDTPIMVTDCAGSVKYEKRLLPVFVGKFISAPANYACDDPIVIYLKGDDKTLIPPTNMEGIQVQHDDEKMVIYSNSKDYAKYLNSKIKKLIKEFHTDKDLLDVSICLKKNRCYVLLGYNDGLMVLPLQNPLELKPLDVYKSNILTASKIIVEFNKIK